MSPYNTFLAFRAVVSTRIDSPTLISALLLKNSKNETLMKKAKYLCCGRDREVYGDIYCAEGIYTVYIHLDIPVPYGTVSSFSPNSEERTSSYRTQLPGICFL